MGPFDRFKSKTATTQEGQTARQRSYEWYEKGLPLCMTDHNEDASPYFDKSLEIDPNYEDARTRKAYALFKLDRFQEALPCFDKSLELNPSDVMAETNKQQVLERNRKTAKK